MQVRALDGSVHTTNERLRHLSEQLHVDREAAYETLRGYLHTDRDCIGTDEAAEFRLRHDVRELMPAAS